RDRDAGHDGRGIGQAPRSIAVRGKPVHRPHMVERVVKWRDQAGWPKEHGGFHALRHFFVTTLISNNAEPKDVQRALRHKTLQITLETYVHWWPRSERRRGVIGQVIADVDRPDEPATDFPGRP